MVKAKHSGFTLVEVILSASVMSIILVSAYVCLNSSLVSQKLIASRTDAVQKGRVALAIMSADLRCACPLAKEIEFLGMQRKLGEAQADNLDFGTHNFTPKRPGEGDFCQVSYFLQTSAQPGLFSLWRRRNPRLGLDPLAGGRREELADGVRGLKFEYYDGFDWYDEWGDPEGRGKAQTSLRERWNLSGLPEAVRITLMIDPSGTPARASGSEEKPTESPLTFQTVVRLNLASVSQPTSGTTDSGSSPTTGNTRARPKAPESTEGARE